MSKRFMGEIIRFATGFMNGTVFQAAPLQTYKKPASYFINPFFVLPQTLLSTPNFSPPLISNLAAGVVVPIPTLPLL
uniref:Uncharacterized protein n=1 Tax=Candidatus Kentrum sp. UNK TaxID=2126344 RepID=A0A451B5U6_9GAMM|nr:MAG: hypothetical protein BECKUNK1418G_GA0071005_12532 [Candidatus Kentron sp. UNK]VFK73665.1 MAG: hypothetical protein BECKUNK1418H_GA0071006_12452 [Candidatus Kentron sp. UNK]